MEYALYIVLAIVILLVMITIHEAGHYIAGKALGFKIDEFSIGLGPAIFSKTLKSGEKFSLRVLPLGGYCAFAGEDPLQDAKKDKDNESAGGDGGGAETAESAANAIGDGGGADADKSGTRGGSFFAALANAAGNGGLAGNADAAVTRKNDAQGLSFNEQKPWKRLIVFFAGAFFNIVSAVIFSVIFIAAVGYAAPKVDKLYYIPAEAGGLTDKAYCDLLPGDEISAVNGVRVSVLDSSDDLFGRVKAGQTADLTVLRNGAEISVPVTKQTIKYIDENSGEIKEYVGFGISMSSVRKSVDFGGALLYCVPFTLKVAWMILGLFGGLLTGAIPLTSITGPVGTVTTMATVSQANPLNILILLPLIAANLAVFNLLPIPALDGSKMVFTAIEWVRGKPINRNVEGWIHFIGFAVILGLIILVDIVGMVLR